MGIFSRRQVLGLLPGAALGAAMIAGRSGAEEIELLGEIYGGGRRTHPRPPVAPAVGARDKRPNRPRGKIGEMREIPVGIEKPFAWGPFYDGVDWAAVQSGQFLRYNLGGIWEAYVTCFNKWGWFAKLWDVANSVVAIIEPKVLHAGRGQGSLQFHRRFVGLTFDENSPVIAPTLHCTFQRYRINGEPFDDRFWSDLDAGNCILNFDTFTDSQTIPDPKDPELTVGPCLVGVWGSLYEFERFGEWILIPEPQWNYLALQEEF